MGTYINKGNTAFADRIRGEYVDKTEMIAFINSTLNTADRLTCVTRPRRFGKSTTVDMLCAYYDKSCHSSTLFDKFAISKDESYSVHLNKYATIHVDITDFTTRYHRRKNIVKMIQKSIKEDALTEFPDITVAKNADLMAVLSAIATKRGEKFIMIIDEWDALCRELSDQPALMDEYVDLLRRMFKGSDTAKTFAGVYMTGILPIKKYGTQSALNDFREYSMTKPGAMGGFLGFNDNDVQRLAEQYGMDYEELKRWYDGYELSTFNWREKIREVHKIAIYNPNSVMTAIRDCKCANYWSKSESFEALQQYIDMDFTGVKETLERLIQGEPIELRALRFGNDQSCINSDEELFTLLTHFGYLSYNEDTHLAVLPNQEIREEFVEALRGSKRHKALSALVRASDRLLKATLSMDEATVAAGIEALHNTKTAPTFYNNEQALRSVVRLAYLGAVDYYLDIEELPSGKGYCDVVFLPRRHAGKPALIVELKWNETTAAAIDQIKRKHYPAKVAAYTGKILLVGINYDKETKQHSCQIEPYTMP